MSVTHHLDDTTLLRYASGSLPYAFNVVVAAHLAMCADCRAALHAAEELGGQLLDEEPVTEMQIGSFELLMKKLEDGDSATEKSDADIADPIDFSGDVPAPLQRLVGPRLADVKWRRIAPGVKKYTLSEKQADGTSLYMLQIAPGMAVPEHGHGGEELTLILSGTYRDDIGVFDAGDIADLDEHIEHQPHVISDTPCVCLVATEAPTRFKDVFSRLLQPLTGV